MRTRTLRYLTGVAVIMAIALLGDVTGNRPLPAAAEEEQVVIDLAASHERINPGECALVEWGVQLTGDWPLRLGNEPVEPHGHREVCPQATTTYILSVETPEGLVSKEVTIAVGGPPEDEGLFRRDEPREGGDALPIEFQVVEPEAIPRGACARLAWEVGDMEEYVVLVNGDVAPRAGNIEICPEETTRYELFVEGPEGPAIREIILQVVDVHGEGEGWEGVRPPEMEGEPPEGSGEVALSLTADPDVIPRGGCAGLNWEVAAPAEYSIRLNGEMVAPQGSRQICPDNTSTYELLVETPGGPVIRHVTLHVVEEPGGEPLPPEPPSLAPQEPSAGGADIRPSDLYADNQPQGVMWGRITNDGHATLSGHTVQVSGTGTATPRSGGSPQALSFAPQQFTLNIAPGQTEVINLGWPLDTSINSYQFQIQVQAVDFTDPNPANNIYAKTVVPTGPAAPAGSTPGPTAAPPAQPPSQPPAPGVLSADVNPTDLYPDKRINGVMWARITNGGPGTLKNNKVAVFGYVTETPLSGGSPAGKKLPAREYVLNIAPGQTEKINLGWPLDLSKSHYDFSVTVVVKDFSDPNPGNNTYSERVEGAKQGGPSPPIPPKGPTPTKAVAGTRVDLDFYSISIIGNKFWTHAQNNGPDYFAGAVKLVTSIVRTDKASGKQDTQSKTETFTGPWAVGKGSALPTKLGCDLTKYKYQVTVTLSAVGAVDEKPANNTLSKSFQ
jgi:hypothetical protein